MQKKVDRTLQGSPERKSCVTKWHFLTIGRNEPNLNTLWETVVHSKVFKMLKIIFYSICLLACEATYYSRSSHQKMVLSSDTKWEKLITKSATWDREINFQNARLIFIAPASPTVLESISGEFVPNANSLLRKQIREHMFMSWMVHVFMSWTLHKHH